MNFALPLLKAKGRGGWSVPFNLVYNSLNWRKDSGGTWKDGYDVGYGFGWKLLAGSIIPTSNGGPHYIFTDASGAEYNFDQNAGTLWTSKEGIYATFDSSTNKIYFNDGSFWVMGCTSANSEADAGTMYPTTIQDPNGNQVMLRYANGVGVGFSNSSARIQEIEDVRAVGTGVFPNLRYYTYAFTYDASLHLQSITNGIGTSEGYTFAMTSTPLYSPFESVQYGTPSILQLVTISGVNLSHQFTTDSSGQLTKVIFPYGGYLRWTYSTAQYTGPRYQSEIQNRYLSKDGTVGSERQYQIMRDPGDSSRTVHYWAELLDPDNKSDKYFQFATSGTYVGLVTEHRKQELPGSPPVQRTADGYTWTTGPTGQAYIASVLTTLDPGASQVQKKTEQTLDGYGNVTQTKQYDWNALTTPARTYTNTFLTDANYTSRYIRNRLLSSTVTGGGQTTTLSTATYDCYGICSLTDVSDPTKLRQHDSSYDINFHYRGNMVAQTDLGGTRSVNYDVTGNVTGSTIKGVYSTGSYQASTNYAAPSSLTTNSLTETMQWTPFLGLTQETGPNGDSSATTFDAYARPSTSTSKTGLVTNYSYASAAPWTVTATLATTPARWTRTTLDGFGRTVKVETGTGVTTSTPVSIAETTYEPCGCSPMGKTKQVSMPHASGATPVWTVYSYDGLGRTVSVLSPDNVSAKTYFYSANTVKVTDEAGKWKKYVMDAFGNLTQVTEPDPANPTTLTYVTTYGYDYLNHLISVSMPRPTGTQTRTFNYGTPPGAYLLSSTNPENGTVTYTYNPGGSLATKTDARNQQTQYGYDSYKRLNQIRHYPVAGQAEDTAAQVNIGYDTSSYQGFTSQYGLGRMTSRQYQINSITYTEMYSYTQPGQVTVKRLRVTKAGLSADLDGGWSYNNEGKLTAATYPTSMGSNGLIPGQTYTYGYDDMGRPKTMTDTGAQQTLVSDVQYGPAGELLSMSGLVSESRTYNSRLQLTSMNGITFTYPAAGSNNGRIQSQTDTLSGEQITYAYDSLNRLISAVTTDNPNVTQWGQGFTYDGFGNLTNKSALKGSAPVLNVGVNAATNRLTGYTYDANGNQTSDGTQTMSYDYENRLSDLDNHNGTASKYGYDPDNRRVYMVDVTNGMPGVETVCFYGVTGQLMGTYSLYSVQGAATLWVADYRAYFGGRLVKTGTNGVVNPDRLGSTAKFYPYGENRGTAGMFATYTRDRGGYDYAVNRYYNSGLGRFMTPDPYRAAPSAAEPGSWNSYGYTRGDPVNANDPSGLLTLVINGSFDDSPEWMDPNTSEGAAELAAIQATFGETPTAWRWTSDLAGVTIAGAYSDIFAAALRLARYLNSYTFAPGESLNIVAHSHGGNVVGMAAGLINRQIDNLVNLGTPQNWDLYPYQSASPAKNYCNVSSLTDTTQFGGASPMQLYFTGYYAYMAGVAETYAMMALWNADFHGFLQNEMWAGIYTDYSFAFYMSTKIDPYATTNVFLSSGSHSDLHTANVWNAIKGPCGLPK